MTAMETQIQTVEHVAGQQMREIDQKMVKLNDQRCEDLVSLQRDVTTLSEAQA